MSDQGFKTVPNAGALDTLIARESQMPSQPPAPKPPEADLAAAIAHLLAGHEQLIGVMEHLASVIPAAGIGAVIGQIRDRLEAAKTALFATPPPSG